MERKLNDVDYIISTPDRRKTKWLCHINMLKEYHERGTPVGIVNASISKNGENDNEGDGDDPFLKEDLSSISSVKMQNSEILQNVDSKIIWSLHSNLI